MPQSHSMFQYSEHKLKQRGPKTQVRAPKPFLAPSWQKWINKIKQIPAPISLMIWKDVIFYHFFKARIQLCALLFNSQMSQMLQCSDNVSKVSVMYLSFFVFPVTGTHDQRTPESCLLHQLCQPGQGRTKEAGHRAGAGSSHLGLYPRESVLREGKKGLYSTSVWMNSKNKSVDVTESAIIWILC